MTPEQEEDVRRALAAAARADEPSAMPEDVRARLDGVLTELTAPRRGESPPGTSTSLHFPPRGRRRWPQVLVAAAAVVAVGGVGSFVVVGGLDDLTGGGADSTGSAGGSSADSGASAPQAEGGSKIAPASVPRLHGATLRRDVRRLLADPPGRRRSSLALEDAGCARPARAAGARVVAVRLDGAPATAVLGPVAEGHRQVRILACSGAPRETLRLPGR